MPPLRAAGGAGAPKSIAALDARAWFGKAVAFLIEMQEPAGMPDEGGIHEVEADSGEVKGYAIIQSDNTQEAIWVWSRWRRLTDDDAVDAPLALAWKYLEAHPGWMEELGNPPADDYRVYNCAWGVRAVLEYEAATGDHARHDYGATCAAYLAERDLALEPKSSTRFAAVLAWSSASLYEWALAEGDATLRAQAVEHGLAAKAWLDTDPTRVGLRQWAVSGGAVLYGVLGTVFREDPAGASDWLAGMSPHLGGFVLDGPKVPSWGEWWNAWSAWNLAGLRAAAKLDPALAPMIPAVLDPLAAQDTDDDGGIPGSINRPDGEDQSWITSYLALMGMEPELDSAPPDAGVSPPEAGSDGGDAPPEGDRDAAVDTDGPGGPDAGTTGGDVDQGGGGCGCHALGSSGGLSPMWLALLAATLGGLARWRRTRAQPQLDLPGHESPDTSTPRQSA